MDLELEGGRDEGEGEVGKYVQSYKKKHCGITSGKHPCHEVEITQ